MNMKINFYVGAAFVAAILLALFLINPFTENHSSAATQNISEIKKIALPNNINTTQASYPASPSIATVKPQASYIQPELQARLDAMQKRRPNLKFDAKEVEAAVGRDRAWATATAPAKDLPLNVEEFKDGRQFIQFDSLKIETLMPGDNLNIAIDEFNQYYEVAIDRVEQQDYDSISWYGHIQGSDGQTYNVSFTRGTTLTVAGIDTPEGNYVLQAHANNGWIASSGLLFKVNPTTDDVVYPPTLQH